MVQIQKARCARLHLSHAFFHSVCVPAGSKSTTQLYVEAHIFELFASSWAQLWHWGQRWAVRGHYPLHFSAFQINTTTLNCTHWETVIREWRQTHTHMHGGRTFCWNNGCDNGTRGQRNEGDLSLAQNESTLGLWTFRSQHLHPQLFHVCAFVFTALPPLRLNVF